MTSYLSMPITKISPLIQNKSISVKELLNLCLARIKKAKDLNAFITVTENVALEQAEQSQKRICEGHSLGVLDGIPIAFKDNWSTRDIRTTCASKMLSNYVAPYNGTVVQKLYDKGICLMGKTNLDEFAMGSATVDSFFGPTKNPWRSRLNYKVRKQADYDFPDSLSLKDDDFFIAGGSSGGAAVAVASGMCFGAIGSDTGGSTRSPAAMCGVVGLKPTYGLISRNGLIPLCNSLDVPGILTRSVDDAVLLLNNLAGPDIYDSTTVSKHYSPFTIPDNVDVRHLHIGIPNEYECPGMSPEVIESWRNVADKFSNAGAKVSTVSLPHTKYSIMCYSVLCCCDVASNFARYDGIRYGHRMTEKKTDSDHPYAVTRREGFGDVVRERILSGNFFLLRKYKYEINLDSITEIMKNIS
nr:glutamyl-tRNA(Gln) amidotransferase subunit A, mitochondrial isoform X2 [Parasteatoda tepidariorum]